MGLLDTIESMAGQQASGQSTNANVAGSLLQELDQHAGGLAGLVSHMQ